MQQNSIMGPQIATSITCLDQYRLGLGPGNSWEIHKKKSVSKNFPGIQNYSRERSREPDFSNSRVPALDYLDAKWDYFRAGRGR